MDYPVAASGHKIVDGEWTIRTEYDEHNRQVQTNTYDYVGPGAWEYVTAQQAGLRAAGGLIRAEVSVTNHKTAHAVGMFTVLMSRDATGVLELVETVTSERSGPLLKELTYPGLAPVVIQCDQPAYVYEQAGRAIVLGAGGWPTPPPALYDPTCLVSGPDTAFERLNDTEYACTWRYRFIFAAHQPLYSPSTRANLNT